MRPRTIAEQPQNFLALLVILGLANRPAAQGLAGEIAPHEEVNVILGNIDQPELEEGLFGFEVADLQNTRDLLGQTYTALHQGALFRCQVEVLGALKVVEVRQALQGRSLGLRYDSEIFIEGAHKGGYFPYRLRSVAKTRVQDESDVA